MTSPRTSIRDAIVLAFTQAKAAPERQVPDYAVSVLFLTDTELKQAATYCVVMTDETRTGNGTLQTDDISATLKVICWASHATDPHGVLDMMIEDACDTLRTALAALKAARQIGTGLIDSISVADAKSTDGPLAQAVIQLAVTFQRPGVRA
jgi:hypothetical protein